MEFTLQFTQSHKNLLYTIHSRLPFFSKEPADFTDNIVTLLKDSRSSDIRKCVFPVSGNLYLLSSIIDLAALEMEVFSKTNSERILDRAIAL
ncbi:MAG: hypothetical protein FWG10_02770 [Eubacteriaceae bacterium]|nr:hypothetical protein [Eubacteriaceae bacterium]